MALATTIDPIITVRDTMDIGDQDIIGLTTAITGRIIALTTTVITDGRTIGLTTMGITGRTIDLTITVITGPTTTIGETPARLVVSLPSNTIAASWT
jgi:hypothetical protein